MRGLLLPCVGVVAAPQDGCHVVIVGAGIAGLATAQTLQRANCTSVVLEARSTIGGRTETLQNGTFAGVELGAHWVHGGLSNQVSAPLLAYLGIPITPIGGDDDFEGKRGNLAILDGQRVLLAKERKRGFHLFQEASNALENYFDKHVPEDCNGTATCRATDQPESAAWAAALKAIAPKLRDEDRKVLDLLKRMKWEQDYGDSMGAISGRVGELAGYTDFYPKHSKGDAFVNGGYRTLVDRLAENVTVHIGTPATDVVHSASGVEVHTPTGVFKGTHVVLTAPAAVLLAKVRVEPSFPQWKTEALQHIGRGIVGKALIKLTAPLNASIPDMYSFVRADSAETDLTQVCIWAGAEHAQRRDILECFLGKSAVVATQDLSHEELMARASKELAVAFGGAVRVGDIKLTQWQLEPYIGQAWSFPPLGAVAGDFDNYAKAVGRVHFAGEGACRLMWGNVHAALATAGRAAHEIVTTMGRQDAVHSDWPLWQKKIRTLCEKSPKDLEDAVLV